LKIEIDVAWNGQEAVDQYQKNYIKECNNSDCKRLYKLIIMDIGMPIKDGYEASKEILQLEKNLNKMALKDETTKNEKCEIIALTSFSDKTTNDICKKIGMKEVLNKPISFNELLRIVLMYVFNLSYA